MAAGQENRRITIYLNGREVSNSIGAIQKEMSVLNRQIKQAEIGTDGYNRAVRDLGKAKSILADHQKAIKAATDSTGGALDFLKGNLASFAGAVGIGLAADQIIRFGTELFTLGVKMEALDRKARVVFGDTLPRVTQEAERNANAMGLTTHEYIAAAAAAQDLLVPMGFTREAAAGISTQLTNLSGALSEWTGGQVTAEQVSTTLTKALLGEREQLKQLGIAISEADVNARLAAKGQSDLTGEIRQQAEATATLELILLKSADAQTAFALNADTTTRRMSEMKATFGEFKEDAANTFLPAFERIVEVLGGITKAIKSADDSLGGKLIPTLTSLALGPLASFGLGKKKKADTGAVTPEQQAILDKQANFQAELAKVNAKGDEEQTKKEKAAADRREKQIAANLARINDLIQRHRDQLHLATLDADEKEIEQVRLKYAAELAEIDRLEKEKTLRKLDATRARAELLRLQEEELSNLAVAGARAIPGLTQAEGDAKVDAAATHFENRDEGHAAAAQFAQDRQAAQEEIALAIADTQELERIQLAEHFAEMIVMAESFGLDTTAIQAKFAVAQADLIKKQEEENTAKIIAENNQRIQAYQSLFEGMGELAAAAGTLFASESGKQNKIAKAFTLAQIAFDTASAIASLTKNSEANPANASTFGIAGVIQFATGIARILINIAKAKQVLSSAPTVPQKAEGGYTTVTGATDGRRYQARYIGPPRTGYLPGSGPVLFASATGSPVLANERGREYVVSNTDLANPRVLDYVSAIENLKTRQFATGGSTASPAPTLSTTAPAAADPGLMAALQSIAATNQAILNALLTGRVTAAITDSAIVDIARREQKILAAAGTSSLN